jgi:hypothetical protein
MVPENGEVQAVLNMIWRLSKVDGTSFEVYGGPMVDPLMSARLNGRPKVLAALEGRRWKLGFGSDDLRTEFRIGGMLALDFLVCYLLSLEQNGNAILVGTIRPCRSGEVFPADTRAE